MKKLSLVLLALVSLAGTTGVASAQYSYGGGYYYDHPRYYRHRYYDYDDYRWRHRYWRYRHYNPCPRGFTVQDGVCKPYRGY